MNVDARGEGRNSLVCYLCAKTRANDIRKGGYQSTCARMIFARRPLSFFVVTPMAKRMTNKQGGKKEAKLKGKKKKMARENDVVLIKGGCFPFCVNNTRRELFLFLIIHTYNSVVWHMTTTHTRRALLHYYFLSASLRTRDALFQLFPYPPAPLFTQDVNRATS